MGSSLDSVIFKSCKLNNLSVNQFLHLQNGHNNTTFSSCED